VNMYRCRQRHYGGALHQVMMNQWLSFEGYLAWIVLNPLVIDYWRGSGPEAFGIGAAEQSRMTPTKLPEVGCAVTPEIEGAHARLDSEVFHIHFLAQIAGQTQPKVVIFLAASNSGA